MSDIGADVLAEWRVVPEDVASLPVFAFCSRGGFVVEGVLVSAFVKYIYLYIYKCIHPPALRKEILYQGPSSILIKCHTIDRIFLVFCSKGKKGSWPTVPGFSCRNIDENGDLDSSGVYWIRPAGSLVSFQGYCDKSAVGSKFTDRNHFSTISFHDYLHYC